MSQRDGAVTKAVNEHAANTKEAVGKFADRTEAAVKDHADRTEQTLVTHFDKFAARVEARVDALIARFAPETLVDRGLFWLMHRRHSTAWVLGIAFALVVFGNVLAAWLAP